MHRHLVAVKVSIETLANKGMNADRIALDEYRLESLNTHPVQGWRAVQEHRVGFGHLFQDVPNLIVLALQHFLGRFDGIGVLKILEPANDERLEELQCDLFGKAALVEF